MQTDRAKLENRWRTVHSELFKVRTNLAATVVAPDLAEASAQSETHQRQDAALLETLRYDNATLTAERDEADAANSAKTKFLAAASHDLRQPLQAMAALQALLSHSAKDTDSLALIEKLDTSLHAISSMLDGLLDDSRIKTGVAAIHIEAVPLSTLFKKLSEAYEASADTDGTALIFAPTEAIVTSDPLLLQQILSNLISNALRFATGGKVLIGARPRDQNILIEVWDNGIGIAPDKAAAIFEEYEQIEPGHGGHGLGLSIVKSLGLLLDHRIALHSIPGSGSVFSVEVPLAAEPQPLPAPMQPPPGKTVLVHIIDDDAAVLDSLSALLTAAGHSVQVHGSAEAFRRDWVPARAACLLVDAGLPGESGLSLLRSLKDAGIMPPSIIITGQGDVATAVAAMRLGTLDFIEKPVPAADILASVADALALDQTRRTAARTRADATKTIDALTRREREVLDHVMAGHPSKNIASDLGISQRTVENHRAAMMRKTACRSLPALVRLVIAAEVPNETSAD